MSGLKSLTDIAYHNKTVLVRVDFNVPIQNGIVLDESRLKASLATIQYLLERKAAKIILVSHLGRPKGRDLSLTLRPVAERLSSLLAKDVLFLGDCIGDEVEAAIKGTSQFGTVFLLENVRFYEAEENPTSDPTFAEKLARLADIYINDAFGTAHRAHSSTTIITQFFSQRCAAGFLLMREVEILGHHFKNPKRPFTAIIGGAKISTKLGVLLSLLDKVDTLLIGGAMSYAFLKARGISVGSFLVDDSMLQQAQQIEKKAKEKNVFFHLPCDVVVAKKISANEPSHVASVESATFGIPSDFEGVDIGPKTIEQWKLILASSKTIFWNGPVGVFEVDPFSKGTFAIAKFLASLKGKAVTIVGGGDSLSALEKLQLQDSISHVSTGGGASLEYIEYGQLPGIQALEKWG